jgi:hypothetical protein
MMEGKKEGGAAMQGKAKQGEVREWSGKSKVEGRTLRLDISRRDKKRVLVKQATQRGLK